MSFELAYSGDKEQVARMTGLFQSLSRRDREAFLKENGLQHVTDPGPGVNTLTISPSRAQAVSSPRVAHRANVALRLVDDDNTILQRFEGKPLMNVSGVRFTDEEMRMWFDKWDPEGKGYVFKDHFLDNYQELEQFGTPMRERWLKEQLAKMHSLGEDRLSFEEFALILTHVALR